MAGRAAEGNHKVKKIKAAQRARTGKRVKAGTSKAAAAERKKRFIAAYLVNGRNASQAALTAGFPKASARQRGYELMTDPEVSAAIAEAAEQAAKIAGLEVNRTLREVARLAYSDPRNLFDASGDLIPVHQLDDETAATIASIEHDEEYSGRGKTRKLIGHTKKLKIWDKNAALEKAMKYHGLYREDNEQQIPTNVSIYVVGIEPGRKSVHPR